MKQCNADYESALSVDCYDCNEENCKYRKEPSLSIMIIAFLFTITIMFAVILFIKELFDIINKLF